MDNGHLWICLWLVTVVIWSSECAFHHRRVETTTSPTVNVTKKERPIKLSQGRTRMHIIRKTAVYSITNSPVTRKLNIFEIPFVETTSKIVSEPTVLATRVTGKKKQATRYPANRLNLRILEAPQTINMRVKDPTKTGEVDAFQPRLDLQVTLPVGGSVGGHLKSDEIGAQLKPPFAREISLGIKPPIVPGKQGPGKQGPGKQGPPGPGSKPPLPVKVTVAPGGPKHPFNVRPSGKLTFTRVPINLWPEYTLGSFHEMGPKRHPSLIKFPTRNDSIRRQWPVKWPCPKFEKFLNECARPRDLDFYPKTKPEDECTGKYSFALPHEGNGSEFEELVGRYVDLKPIKPHVACTSPTSTPGPTTYKCPTTTRPLAHDPLCLYSCTFPKTTGCCTDPTSTCSEPTSTEKPVDCCTEPTNTPYVPPLYKITCYELTEKVTTPRPCICFKVLEFTMTKDKCLPSCTEPTSTCPPPVTTSLPSTCATKTTPCVSPTPHVSTCKPKQQEMVPCGCLTSSVEQTTCRKSVTTETPCVVKVPTTCTIICSEKQPPCTTTCATTATCIRKYVRNADEDKIIEADYAKNDVNNSRRDVSLEPCSLTTTVPYFNWWSSSSANPFNNLYVYLAWPESLNKTRFSIEVNTCSLASKLSVGIVYIGLKVVLIGLWLF